jgi:hypothetical protein
VKKQKGEMWEGGLDMKNGSGIHPKGVLIVTVGEGRVARERFRDVVTAYIS